MTARATIIKASTMMLAAGLGTSVLALGGDEGLQGFSKGDLHGVQHSYEDIVTVRPPAEVTSKQGLPYFVGISAETAGAEGISMNMVIIPPGGSAKPHLHSGYESAIYLLKGRVETHYGEGLRKSVVNEEGDFIFIPPDVPHQPHNLSSTEPAIAIVARNDPREQEHVTPYEIED